MVEPPPRLLARNHMVLNSVSAAATLLFGGTAAPYVTSKAILAPGPRLHFSRIFLPQLFHMETGGKVSRQFSKLFPCSLCIFTLLQFEFVSTLCCHHLLLTSSCSTELEAGNSNLSSGKNSYVNQRVEGGEGEEEQVHLRIYAPRPSRSSHVSCFTARL